VAKRVTKESVIFPRYHQLDAVQKVVQASRGEGPGRNYLIQHSAGSGKTNSISWLSHRLASLHDTEDRKVFDCVVVITDRRVLDQQLQNAIYQIEHAQACQGDRSRQQAACGSTYRRHQNRDHDAAEIPVRAAGSCTRRAETQENATAEEKDASEGWRRDRETPIRRDRGRSAFQPDWRDGARVEGDPRAEAWEDPKRGGLEDRLNQVIASRGKQPRT